MRRAPRRVRLGLLGFGTVGQALVRLIQKEAPRLSEAHGVDLSLAAVGVRGGESRKALWIEGNVRFTDDLASVVGSEDVDLVVELLGGLEPAGTLVRSALEKGKSVVTANKLLLAKRGVELAEAAAKSGAGLGLEASVAGGIPILRAIRESFAGDRLRSVTGILNGTCNFILTEMEKTGRGYAEVLAEAQRKGYAEADPASDVEGEDAAYKLTLLSRMAFGRNVSVEDIPREGITKLLACDFVYARQLGRTLRQLAVADETPGGRLVLSVRTHLVSSQSLLAKVEGPFNAVQLRGDSGGEFVFYGRGAGGAPTATAVLADVLELARSEKGVRRVPPLGYARFAPSAPAGPEDFISSFYLRFVVRDRPGIIADISRALANHAINIDAVFQAPYGDKAALPFVITLEPVSQQRLDSALAEIGRLDFHTVLPLALPTTG
jgi:homoserine dehydrogenase